MCQNVKNVKTERKLCASFAFLSMVLDLSGMVGQKIDVKIATVELIVAAGLVSQGERV